MQNQYRRLLLAVNVLLWAIVGAAERALALTFTEFRIPTASSEPEGIAKGPDGALWFTEFLGSKIGRITTDGVITEFPIPTGFDPESITTGPDGALWFTESVGNRIGRITTAGVISEFVIPDCSPQCVPAGITTGSDGALWFTEGDFSFATGIGRITTAGVITKFPIAGGSLPVEITMGPDGALWFIEFSGNQIGRLALTTVNSHDFNVDGKSDIAWRDTSGNAAVWLMNGAQVIQSVGIGIGSAPTTWSVVGQRDFDGDGRHDWLWQDTGGNVAIWLMSGTQVTQSAGVGSVPNVWSIQGANAD